MREKNAPVGTALVIHQLLNLLVPEATRLGAACFHGKISHLLEMQDGAYLRIQAGLTIPELLPRPKCLLINNPKNSWIVA